MIRALMPTTTAGVEIATAGALGVLGTLAMQSVVGAYVQRSWAVTTNDDVELKFSQENIAVIRLFQEYCPGATANSLPNFGAGAPDTAWWRPTVRRTVRLPRYESSTAQGSASITSQLYSDSIGKLTTVLSQYESTRTQSILHGQTREKYIAGGRRVIEDHRVLFGEIFTVHLLQVLSHGDLTAQRQGLQGLIDFCEHVIAHAHPDLKKTRKNSQEARTFERTLENLIRHLRASSAKLAEERDKILFRSAINATNTHTEPVITSLVASLTATIYPDETARKMDPRNVRAIVQSDHDSADADEALKLEYLQLKKASAYKAAFLSAMHKSFGIVELNAFHGSISNFLLAQFRAGYVDFYASRSEPILVEDMHFLENALLTSRDKCEYLIKNALLQNAGWKSSRADREVNASKAAKIIYGLIEIEKQLELFREISESMTTFVNLNGESVIIGAPQLIKFFGAHLRGICGIIEGLQESLRSLKAPLSIVNSTLLGSLYRVLTSAQEHQVLFARLEDRVDLHVAGLNDSGELFEKCITPGHQASVKANLRQNLIQLYDYAHALGAPDIVDAELSKFDIQRAERREVRPMPSESRHEARTLPHTLISVQPTSDLAMAAGVTPGRKGGRVSEDAHRYTWREATASSKHILKRKLYEHSSNMIKSLRVDDPESRRTLRSTAHAILSGKTQDMLSELYLEGSHYGLSTRPIVQANIALILSRYRFADLHAKRAMLELLPSITETSLNLLDIGALSLERQLQLIAILDRKSFSVVMGEIRHVSIDNLSRERIKNLWTQHCKSEFENNPAVIAVIEADRLQKRAAIEAKERQRRIAIENLNAIKISLEVVLSSYVASTKSAGWLHRHGKGGKKRVEEIREQLLSLGTMENLLQRCIAQCASVEVAYQAAMQTLHESIIREAHTSEGKLHDHSLKTYLLTYRAWLLDQRRGDELEYQRPIVWLNPIQVDERLSEYCAANPDKKRRKEDLASYITTFRLQGQAAHDQVVVEATAVAEVMA